MDSAGKRRWHQQTVVRRNPNNELPIHNVLTRRSNEVGPNDDDLSWFQHDAAATATAAAALADELNDFLRGTVFADMGAVEDSGWT